jgi:hypothetical protein
LNKSALFEPETLRFRDAYVSSNLGCVGSPENLQATSFRLSWWTAKYNREVGFADAERYLVELVAQFSYILAALSDDAG